MKAFLISLCLFAVIIGTVVLATRDELSGNRPKTRTPIAHPPVVCTQPRVEPAVHIQSPEPQPVKVIERLKVIKVPITKIYVKEVYHTQQIIYIPNGSSSPAHNIPHRPAPDANYTQPTRDNWDESRKAEWELRKAG
jgi:hypothetical protein